MKYKGITVELTKRREDNYGYCLPWGTQGIGFLSLAAAIRHARQAVDSKLKGEKVTQCETDRS